MEWTNLADSPEHAKTKESLAAMLPQNPNRTKVAQLTEADLRLADVPEGRYRKSDPANYVPLKETLE